MARLLNQVRDNLRWVGIAGRTERCCDSIRRFVLACVRRHSRALGAPKVAVLFSDLAYRSVWLIDTGASDGV